jgi:hypothetical protein
MFIKRGVYSIALGSNMRISNTWRKYHGSYNTKDPPWVNPGIGVGLRNNGNANDRAYSTGACPGSNRTPGNRCCSHYGTSGNSVPGR